MSVTHDDIEERLASSGHRLTPQRLTILEALRDHATTVTAQELFEELRNQNPYIGRATVFRNLDALVEIGLARRFERAGHIYAYASCSGEHHHHLLCTSCNQAIEIDEALVMPLVQTLDSHYGFAAEHGALDFYGTCQKCRMQR